MSENIKQYPKKMKLAKYISVAVLATIFFLATLILISLGNKNLGNKNDFLYLAAIGGIIALVTFTSTTFSMLGYSIKQFISAFKFKQEKGLWKILNFVFKIALFIFGVLITIFWLVWFINMLKDTFGKIEISSIKNNGFKKFGVISIAHILGKVDLLEDYNINKATSPLYITSFVFTIIWSGAGIAFEIVKKILGGNRAKKQKIEK